MQVKVETQKRFRLPEMEGAMARWYARQRGSASQMKVYRKQAALLTEGLPSGARVLDRHGCVVASSSGIVQPRRIVVSRIARAFSPWTYSIAMKYAPSA